MTVKVNVINTWCVTMSWGSYRAKFDDDDDDFNSFRGKSIARDTRTQTHTRTYFDVGYLKRFRKQTKKKKKKQTIMPVYRWNWLLLLLTPFTGELSIKFQSFCTSALFDLLTSQRNLTTSSCFRDKDYSGFLLWAWSFRGRLSRLASNLRITLASLAFFSSFFNLTFSWPNDVRCRCPFLLRLCLEEVFHERTEKRFIWRNLLHTRVHEK